MLKNIADFYFAHKQDCDYLGLVLVCFCIVFIPYGITKIVTRRRE